jgi:hypothetical protein
MHDLQLVEAPPTPLFARPFDHDETIRLRNELGAERERRAEAEQIAEQLAGLVAEAQAELLAEREARNRAESASSHLARLVAEEHAKLRATRR